MLLKRVIILLCLIFLVILLLMIVLTCNDTDFCLDTGYCKEGLELNTENGKIIVNEQTCIENDGSWISDKKVCMFK